MIERWEHRWGGWGDPAHATSLTPAINALLAAWEATPTSTKPLTEIRLPPSRVDSGQLASIVGDAHVHTDSSTRLQRASGKSTPDLLRQRSGSLPYAPDVVACPASHDEVQALLTYCSSARLAVVPHGGGTSVVGGLTPQADRFAGVVAVDLWRLDSLLDLDPVSRTATLSAGMRAPAAEKVLNEHGFTLGHFPQSFEHATIGGFAATRSSGQASAGYGRFDAMVVALTVATPSGSLTVGRAPATATGPDLRQLFLGSEGALGIITSVTVRLRPVPTQTSYHAWRFDSFEAGLDAVRSLAQDGLLPTVLRLSDELESTLQYSVDGCLLLTAHESHTSHPSAASPAVSPQSPPAHPDLAPSRSMPTHAPAHTDTPPSPSMPTPAHPDTPQSTSVLADVAAPAGATPLDPEIGTKWLHGRYAGPYLRDAMLDAGAFVETLETAAFWSRLPALYRAVRSAFGDSFLVLAHVSHVYETGASLYFTVVSPMLTEATWLEVKARVSDAILANGGTISHHHGVGTDHRDWFVHESGELAIDTLRAAKHRLDPHSILNPGILIPLA